MSKFTVYTDKQNEFRWKFATGDNSVLAKSSLGFKSKDECISSLTLVQKSIVGATVDHEVRSAAAPGPVSGAPASTSPAASAGPSVSPRN